MVFFTKVDMAAMRSLPIILLLLSNSTPSVSDALSADHEGAQIFAERCVLCHGNYGAGDGFMPLIIEDYPETNLLHTKKRGRLTEMHQTVKWGGAKGQMDNKSPPWINELSASELEAVSNFVVKLQQKPEEQWQILNTYLANKPVNTETGRLVYQTRCSGCHGESGLGDGPIAAVVKSPPPTNLVESQMTESQLVRIISLGGTSVGRSSQMPGWKDEITPVEIDSVAAYVRLLRR